MPAKGRRRVPLPFGSGLDRESGSMVVQPASMEDVRNVLLEDGKAVIRGGFSPAIEFDEADTVVAGEMMKSERVGIVAGYNTADETMHVFRVATDGTSYDYLGEWSHDQGGWGATPPVVHMAESRGRMFLAHDKVQITQRAQTIFYDFSTGLLTDLEADLDGSGDAPIRFRGVVRHLAYLFGWGFGSTSENRPELVRVSKPGEPHLWEKNSYFFPGDRRDPVLRCVPLGKVLLVLKEAETYYIFGSAKRGSGSFGHDIADPLYGLAAPRLAVNFSGFVIAWTAEGPRVWTEPGPSEDLETPLDLDGWEPSDLVEEGDTQDAFAHYVPGARVVLFVFGRRVYALSVRRIGDWKWSYWELGFTPRCAMTFFTGGAASGEITGPPTGHPEFDSAEAFGSYADITFDNVDQDGDEVVELWLRPDGGAWTQWAQTPVDATSPQTERLGGTGLGEDLDAGTAYDVQLRYRRGTLYEDPYDDDDPDTWPAVSLGSFTTTINPAAIDSCVWARNSDVEEGVTLTVTPAAGQEGQDVEIWRDSALVHTESAPAAQFTWEDTGITGETTHEYQTKTLGASVNSPLSDVHECYAGPQSPPSIDWASAFAGSTIGEGFYEVRWIDGDPDLETEIWDSYDTAGETNEPFPETLRGTEPATNDGSTPGDQHFASGTIGSDLSQKSITIGVRHKQTAFGVDDFSEYDTIQRTFPAMG